MECRWHWDYKHVKDGTIAPHFGILSQTIPNLIPNGFYTLSFAAYNDNTNTDSDYFLRVKIDENQISEGSSLGLTNLVTTFEITFQAPASAAQGVKLSFESQNNAGSVFVSLTLPQYPLRLCLASEQSSAAVTSTARRDRHHRQAHRLSIRRPSSSSSIGRKEGYAVFSSEREGLSDWRVALQGRFGGKRW
jgi:hypothetical protein